MEKKIVIREHEESDVLFGMISFSTVETVDFSEKKLSVVITIDTGKKYEFVSLETRVFHLFMRGLIRVNQAPESYVIQDKMRRMEKTIELQKQEIEKLTKTIAGQKNVIEQLRNIVRTNLGTKPLEEIKEGSEDGEEYLGQISRKIIDSETIKTMVDEEFKKTGILGMLTRDTLLWKATFENCNPRIKGVLRRILCVLRWGGLLFRVRDSNDWQFWCERNWPIVSSLSHGGRVIIQLPPSGSTEDSKYGTHGFWKWIVSGNPECYLSEYISLKTSGTESTRDGKFIFKRLGSTHTIQVFSEEEADIGRKVGGEVRKNGESYKFILPGGRQKIVYERKTIELLNVFSGGQAGEKNYVKHKHWGMNVPLGGENKIRLDGKLIRADGKNGHLYMFYQEPKRGKFGAVMFGLEGSEYGKKDSTGMKHSIRAKSNPFSPTFGYKWFSKKHNDLRPFKCPDKYNSMLVDLSISGYDFLIEREKLWKDDMIYATSQEVEELKRDIDGIETYVSILRKKKKKAKRGFMSSFSKGVSKRFSRNMGKN